MKRLVDLRDLEPGQYKELTHMLRREGIFLHETTTNFMAYGAIWVRDDDFPRAIELLRGESASYAARARAKWEREWRIEYKSSYARWLAQKFFHSPLGMIAQIVLLLLVLWLFVLLPIHSIRAGAI
jgi:hypothetical protein